MTMIKDEKLQRIVDQIMDKNGKRKMKKSTTNEEIADNGPDTAVSDIVEGPQKEHIGFVWADNLYEFLWHN